MNDRLHFLQQQACVAIQFERESDSWRFTFSGGAVLRVECWWRLISNGTICTSRSDHEQQFGSTDPIDAGQRVRGVLEDVQISSASLAIGTSDLNLAFTNNAKLEIITNSSGYESWHLTRGNGWELIALGGGACHVVEG